MSACDITFLCPTSLPLAGNSYIHVQGQQKSTYVANTSRLQKWAQVLCGIYVHPMLEAHRSMYGQMA